jgi:hypothetical protein
MMDKFKGLETPQEKDIFERMESVLVRKQNALIEKQDYLMTCAHELPYSKLMGEMQKVNKLKAEINLLSYRINGRGN